MVFIFKPVLIGVLFKGRDFKRRWLINVYYRQINPYHRLFASVSVLRRGGGGGGLVGLGTSSWEGRGCGVGGGGVGCLVYLTSTIRPKINSP